MNNYVMPSLPTPRRTTSAAGRRRWACPRPCCTIRWPWRSPSIPTLAKTEARAPRVTLQDDEYSGRTLTTAESRPTLNVALDLDRSGARGSSLSRSSEPCRAPPANRPPPWSPPSGAAVTLSRTMQILTAHEKRFRHTINLVASENLLSPAARWAMSSDLAHRYCIPPADRRPPAIWDYPNQKYTRQIEAEAERLAAHALGGEGADVRPLSGNNGAYILIQALVEPGGRIASVRPVAAATSPPTRSADSRGSSATTSRTTWRAAVST